MRTAYLLTANVAEAESLARTALAKTSLAWWRVDRSGGADRFLRRALVDAYLLDAQRSLARRLLRRRAAAAPARNPDVEAVLGSFSPRRRAAVVLRTFDELSDEDVADALDCPAERVPILAGADAAPSRGLLQDALRTSTLPAPGADQLHAAVAVEAGRVRRKRGTVAAACAAAAVLLAAIVLPLLSEATSPAFTPPASAATSTPSTAAARPAARPPAASAAPAVGQAVAVYYLGAGRGRPLLHREFRRTASRDRLRAALELMIAGPLDPDYRSPWPAGSGLRSVAIDGNVAAVDLTAAAARGAAGAAACQLLQQLVWTTTAADPSIDSVSLSVEGETSGAVSGWHGVGCGPDAPMARHNAADTLTPVQISTFNEGDPVRSRFSFGGDAATAGGSVSWSVADAAGTVLAAGAAETSETAPARSLWQAIVVLTGVKPGDVVELRAWEQTAAGAARHVDTKLVTISR